MQHQYTSEELNAISRLVSASPKLLEALRIASAMRNMYGHPTPVGLPAMNRSIAAATGPEPTEEGN